MIGPPVDDFVQWFFKLLISGVLGLFWWRAKKSSEKLEDHGQAIAVLKESAVTQDTVRHIFREEFQSFTQSMEEVKQITRQNSQQLSELSLKIAAEEGYRRAMAEHKR